VPTTRYPALPAAGTAQGEKRIKMDTDYPAHGPHGEAQSKRWTYIIPMAVIMYILAYVDRINDPDDRAQRF
jgi:hypothetical protein